MTDNNGIEGPCVKCGGETGWAGPTWHRWLSFAGSGQAHDVEALRYSCLTCGYERDIPTKDASSPLPPLPGMDPGAKSLSPSPPGDIGGIHYPEPWFWERWRARSHG